MADIVMNDIVMKEMNEFLKKHLRETIQVTLDQHFDDDEKCKDMSEQIFKDMRCLKKVLDDIIGIIRHMRDHIIHIDDIKLILDIHAKGILEKFYDWHLSYDKMYQEYKAMCPDGRGLSDRSRSPPPTNKVSLDFMKLLLSFDIDQIKYVNMLINEYSRLYPKDIIIDDSSNDVATKSPAIIEINDKKTWATLTAKKCDVVTKISNVTKVSNVVTKVCDIQDHVGRYMSYGDYVKQIQNIHGQLRINNHKKGYNNNINEDVKVFFNDNESFKRLFYEYFVLIFFLRSEKHRIFDWKKNRTCPRDDTNITQYYFDHDQCCGFTFTLEHMKLLFSRDTTLCAGFGHLFTSQGIARAINECKNNNFMMQEDEIRTSVTRCSHKQCPFHYIIV